MQNFIIALLICSVVMSAIALLYMAGTPFFSKRYSEKWRYYAWMVIVVGLLIPFRPQLGNALVSVEAPALTWVYFANHYEGIIFNISGESTRRQIPHTQNLVTPSIMYNISWWQVGFAVWMGGMMVFFAHHIIKHYRFLKTVLRWSEEITDIQILSLYENIKSEVGIKKRIPLYLCPFGSPMMIGLINPRIFLPTKELTYDELRFIFQHELVHYKRKDLLYKYFVVTAVAVHWFNPIVHLMARVIHIQCEISCDAVVMQNADKDTRQSYCKALIGVVKYQSNQKTALSTNFYMSKEGVKSRIISIMDSRRKKAGIVVVCLAVVLTIGAGFVFAATPPVIVVYSPVIVVDREEGLIIEPYDNLPIRVIESANRRFTMIDRTAIMESEHYIEALLPPSNLSFEDAAKILAETIYQEFGFCIDGMSGSMSFWGWSYPTNWTGVIISEELTSHDAGGDALFVFFICDITFEVFVVKNIVETNIMCTS